MYLSVCVCVCVYVCVCVCVCVSAQLTPHSSPQPRVQRQLLECGVQLEQFGGDVQAVEISATQVGVVSEWVWSRGGCGLSGIDAIIVDPCPSQKNQRRA